MQSAEKGEAVEKLLEPGDMFGDYTVEKLLGKGGMGAVYLVRAPDGERYAVKLMFPEIASKNPDFRKRFAREAEFAMRIKHKNLISVYDVGEDPDTGYCYIIMDYVPGGSVKDRLAANGALPIAEAVSIAAQIALALEVAHRHGVVHRDIKPDNIMFDADGTPKLADLGVAKFTDDEHKTTVTTTGMIIGTPAYMAPEQMMDSHHIDARADIYALGVVLYEMLTGRRPTEGSSAVELLAKALKGESLPDVRTMRPEISVAIAHVLSLMCAPKPEDRPPTTLAVAELLQKAATGRLVLPKKVPRSADARRAKRPFPVAACILGALVLGVATFGWRAWQKRTGATGVPPVGERATGTTGVSPVDGGISESPRHASGVPPVGESDKNVASRDTTPPQGSGIPVASRAQSANSLYCVVDLSAGPNASKYPVKWLTVPPSGGFNVDEYKTTKLVLRRIEPGKFMMGGKYEVTLTKPFYCGVFEVTQKQYELVTGSNPSQFKGDMRPVENVSWNMIRGDSATYNWPSSANVDSSTFMGKIQTRTDINFDLPTEAQWEYACRAGTTSKYNNGGDSETDLKKVARFALNQKKRRSKESDESLAKHEPDGKGGYWEGHTVVGSYVPNAWGLYDMHGNAWEVCLDWKGNLSGGVTDPQGSSSGRARVKRGGCWDSFANFCTSSCPNGSRPSGGDNQGFRLCMNPEAAVCVSAQGSVAPAVSLTTGEKLPKETSPRPKPLSFDLGGGVMLEMVGCPAARFQRRVFYVTRRQTLEITRPFWIGKFPVTVEQWERLMPRTEPPQGATRDTEYPRVPVMGGKLLPKSGLVRWTVSDFMDKLTRKYRDRIPAGYTFRLPTMAEWAHAFMAMSDDPSDPYADNNQAARADSDACFVTREDSISYWGKRGVDMSRFREGCWIPYVPVGQRRPNKWGICDMGGVTVEPLLDSGVYDSNGGSVEARFGRFLQRYAGTAFADGARDPLIFEAYDSGDPQRNLALVNQGGGPSDSYGQHRYASIGPIPYGFCYRTPGTEHFVMKLRLCIGPDLLKERGITPPKLDANGKDVRSPSVNGKDVRSPRVESYKLLSERPKPLTIKFGKGEQLELVGCPSGTFTMGYEGGGPQHAPHKVTISRPFWAGKYPVTRAQWDLFMPPRPLCEIEIALGGSKGAVSRVARKDADEYCQQLTKRYRRLLPQGYVFRLPTIAENEYFWRAGSIDPSDPYSKPYGLTAKEKNTILVGDEGKKEILRTKGINWDPERFFKNPYTTPSVEVGLRKSNMWGIFDSLGNIYMWLLDTVASERSKGFKWGIEAVADLKWASSSSDPLFWSDEGIDGTGIAVKSTASWGESPLVYLSPGTGTGALCLGFRIVAGPDLVKEKLSGKVGGAAADSTKSIVVFPRADMQDNKWKKRVPWRYTMKVPPANWMESGFRDGMWKRTNKPLGFGKDASFMRIAEKWNTSDIWLRRHFTWKKSGKVTEVVFDMLHDEDVEIYLNGTRILEEKGANTDWEPFSVSVETFMSAVKEGDNVLAVKVHDGAAPRCFDCGLTVQTEEVK